MTSIRIKNNTDLNYEKVGMIIDYIIFENKKDNGITNYYGKVDYFNLAIGGYMFNIKEKIMKTGIEFTIDEEKK